MKSNKDINNVSKETIKKLGLSEAKSVTIILAGLRYENGVPMAPAALAIPAEDRITDPTTGEPVSIANVRNILPNGALDIQNVQIFANEGGMRTYDTGNVSQREELEYLLLSNYNGSNPNRDTTVPIVFYVSNPEAEKKANMKEKLALGKALGIVANMKDAELKTYALARGMEVGSDPEVIRAEIIVHAEKDPHTFMKSIDPEYQHIIATIRKGEYDGLLTFNPATSSWGWAASGDTIVTLPRSKNQDRYDGFKKWMDESDEAQTVFETIATTVGTVKAKAGKGGKNAEKANTEEPPTE